jgi:hypothetical protein
VQDGISQPIYRLVLPASASEVRILSHRVIVYESADTCQIEKAVWDYGILDEAMKVQGDLWWDNMNIVT